jgi:hypothetical protein
MPIPKTFTYSQPASAFWQWASENEPRHRHLTVGFLNVKGKRDKLRSGGDLLFWTRLLDFLVEKGWPKYGIVWTSDKQMVVFDRYLYQDIKNEIQRKRIC